MSFTKKDRTIQSLSGNTFLGGAGTPLGNGRFAIAIAEALRREYVGRSGAVKLVARLTGANERAVKNWFAGKNGPSGEHLVVLARLHHPLLPPRKAPPWRALLRSRPLPHPLPRLPASS